MLTAHAKIVEIAFRSKSPLWACGWSWQQRLPL